ncbi:N-acyl-D-amino-acid deacylase family protein [Paracidovorax konjaci]|uniref:N-acyl-D-amino-acid deacylase n=1 Tax=Paracidovorax konjaci TaxID=32040 RepID=A0A1I1THU8_9BURK|nr:D-aminoacylase [Paracidovorax konjaci]SFD58221.1 N-acyl-D-amino-acid deacylase [Paracidovorax konjaci]
MLDLIIEGGTVVDGSAAPRQRADVGVRNGRIAAVGDLRTTAAHRRHGAAGRIVCPGFIDVHTHDDRLLLTAPSGPHPKLTQGVTTVVTGNCGISLAPLCHPGTPPAPLDLLGAEDWRYARFGDYLDALEAARPALNALCLVGHSTLRVRHVADLQRPATREEAARMAADLEDALDAGAGGLSTGLYYPPARAATADEVIAVGAPLAAAGGILTMHLRDEADAIDDALREGLHIGAVLGVETVLSHHKLIGQRNHGRSTQTLAAVDSAAAVQPVCMDCYPYNASSTMLLASRVGQSREVLVTWSRGDPSAAGRSLFALARERGCTPEALVERLAPAGAVYFAMDEGDVRRILAHPLTMVGSDGLAHDAVPHPRLWGTFPRVLGHYAREQRLFSLETAVHKMTGMSARRFGLQGRGRIAAGCAADIVVFDEAAVADRATFEQPTAPSAGIEAVFVNGRLACEQGRTVDAHAGQVLRRA